MEYSHRYPAYPTQAGTGELERHIDIHRQAYNYTRYEYQNKNADTISSAYKHHDRLTDWKTSFPSSQRFTRKLSNEPSRGSIRTSPHSSGRKGRDTASDG
jgi:putative transposase